jgi:alkylated DNA nucleotide flippase Atl1
MDTNKLRIILEGIPSGRWVSYADVVEAVGGAPAAARRLNQTLIRHELPNAHRVLKSDGRVAMTALGAPDEVRAKLDAEGIEFDDKDRASQDQRVRPEPIGTVEAAVSA